MDLVHCLFKRFEIDIICSISRSDSDVIKAVSCSPLLDYEIAPATTSSLLCGLNHLFNESEFNRYAIRSHVD